MATELGLRQGESGMKTRSSFVFRCLTRGLLRTYLYLALPIASVGCGLADPGFNTLHPRETTDCSRHIDGSFYGIGGRVLGENDVGAIVFPMGTRPPLIEVSYSIVCTISSVGDHPVSSVEDHLIS